ncbi:hypothetical protein AV530_006207 [Patagioenas fasciata monilis]|uniref:MROH2B-like N-terminal HEAT-repeats domain-containing protein n=1 Tax=Patagioenas fasciata monilis TaxID=372326 RepID=A0A1V4KRE2_PATFA|nr:hypothetical protein AV530_006207 [Patagioenas fasciata monilis]
MIGGASMARPSSAHLFNPCHHPCSLKALLFGYISIMDLLPSSSNVIGRPDSSTDFRAVVARQRAPLKDETGGSQQRPQGDEVETYRALESVLQQDNGCLTSSVVNHLIAEVSSDMQAAQGVADDVKAAASNILVALARCHFHL